MAAPNNQRQKRYLSDLKRRIPEVPCDLESSGLTYADLLKLQKRASDLQIGDVIGGERQRWFRKILAELEVWAGSAIAANESREIRSIRNFMDSGERIFSKVFIKTVPLYKLLFRTNRKRLRLLDEYESKPDEWLPLSVSITPISQLEGLLSPLDTDRLNNLYNRWTNLVSSGYFDLQSALELLHGLHDIDLRDNPSFPLLGKALKLLSLDLSKIDSEPLFIRVRPSVVSKLIAVVALSPVFGKGTELPPTYAAEVQRAIERANDAQFRKVCDQRLNMLLIRSYPQKISDLIEAFNRPYGNNLSPKLRKSIRRKPLSVTPSSSQGMRTRSAKTDRPRRVRLTPAPLAMLERALKEGERLLRLSKNDRDIESSLEQIQELVERIYYQQSVIEAAVEASDISTWIGIDVWNEEFLWVYKLELECCIRRITQSLKNIRPGLVLSASRSAQSAIRRLRLEHDLCRFILNREPVSLDQIEDVIVGDTRYGLVKTLADTHNALRTSLRTRLAGLDIEEISQWLVSVQKTASEGPFLVSIETCDQVSVANTLIRNATRLFESADRFMAEIGEMDWRRDEFVSLENAESIVRSNPVLEKELSDILEQISDIKDVVRLTRVRTSPADPVNWMEYLFALDWVTQARPCLCDGLDVNALITLHKTAESMSLGAVLANTPMASLLAEISGKVETITNLIDQVTSGDFSALKTLNSYGLVTPEIERVKMDIEDYQTRLILADRIISSDETEVSMKSVARIIEASDEFFERYKAVSGDDHLQQLRELSDLNTSLSSLRDREEVESALNKLTRFSSDEISRAKRHLEKTKDLESEIDQIAKKLDTVNTNWSKLVELVETKHSLLKKSGKLKISLTSRGFRKIVLSTFHSVSNLVQQWASSGGTARRPKWVYLYILRSVGGFLQAETGQQVPSLGWLTKQLDACNEIIKDAKKSLSDFAKARFMVPLFHFALYEPLEKVRQNLESKSGFSIAFNYASGERRLESVSSHDKGKVRERIFPRVGGPAKSALIEPPDSSNISESFEKRKSPESMDQAIDQLLMVLRAIIADCSENAVSSHGERLKTGSSTEGGMSFTKFLSSSFSNLDIGASVAVPEVELAQEGSGKSFLDRYYELMQTSSSRKPSPPSTPSGSATPLDRKRLLPPAAVAPPPGVGAPPGISAPPKAQKIITSEASTKDPLIVWQGELVGPKHAFRLPISLVPLFKSPSGLVVKQALASHSNWQYEGSLGLAKFVEHYTKLMHPAHRAKREPYNLVIASDQSDRFFECLPPNTATAFTIIIAPYKVKLWTVTADGSVPYHPLPMRPRIASAFIEMPLPLLHNAGPVENVFDASELESRISTIRSELENIGHEGVSVLECSSPASIQGIRTVVEEPQPMHAPVPVEDPLMSRVYQAMSARRETEPLPPPIPREVKRMRSDDMLSAPTWQAPPSAPPQTWNPMSTYYSRPGSVSMGPPSAMPTLVIGAPSSGQNIDQLPHPKRGSCRFFNTVQGCQSGSRCKFLHTCAVCGSESHPAMYHENQQPGYSRY